MLMKYEKFLASFTLVNDTLVLTTVQDFKYFFSMSINSNPRPLIGQNCTKHQNGPIRLKRVEFQLGEKFYKLEPSSQLSQYWFKPKTFSIYFIILQELKAFTRYQLTSGKFRRRIILNYIYGKLL